MTREECENQILEKLKEIKDIVKQYDTSEESYLTMTIRDDCVYVNNTYWETETPLDAIGYNDGKVKHVEHSRLFK